MALIRLSGRHAVGRHEFALVDDDMFDFLSQWKWKAKPNGSGNHVYAVRNVVENGKNRTIRMHRLVLGMDASDARDADHINRNGLDNRRANLRAVDRRTNVLNTAWQMRTAPCKHCGVHVTRQVDLAHAATPKSCDGCAADRKRKAPQSTVRFERCMECGASFTARKVGALFCSEACRCRARYRRGRVPSALLSPRALRARDLFLGMKFSNLGNTSGL
ncbi:hypothetical protein CBA19CS22_00590 [Caballeronia novacaledonica]|uniref:Uncharacterized protein n=1 Tax=Caballeronia novacaledonica TaxID=1544861 RepID=A0ACB5QJB3_9BURK|nr:hypothetical protein CBA19CS22_00590 [Caballeronia novacaledonica]